MQLGENKIQQNNVQAADIIINSFKVIRIPPVCVFAIDSISKSEANKFRTVRNGNISKNQLQVHQRHSICTLMKSMSAFAQVRDAPYDKKNRVGVVRARSDAIAVGGGRG